MEYEALPLLGGPFAPVETYVYFDGRQTFSMRSLAMLDLYYIVNTVDESDEDDTLTALAVAVNGDRFRAIRAGVVPFRDAFAMAGPFAVFQITWTFADVGAPVAEIGPISAESIPNRWLPVAGVRLDLPTETAKPFELDELISLASAQARTVYSLEVQTPHTRITGFPGRNAGELQVAFDRQVVALSKEIAAKVTSRYSSKTAQEIHTSVLGLRAASFVLIMGIDTVGPMMEATEVTGQVMTGLNSLISSVEQSNDAFLAAMKTHNPAVRNRFLDILRPVAEAQSGLTLSSVVANTQTVIRSTASADRVLSAVQAIELVRPDVRYIDVPRGILTGLVIRRRRFEIVDAADPAVLYRGEMTPAATVQANGLRVGDESFVTASIRVEIPFADEDDLSGTRYILESIELRESSVASNVAPPQE